MADPRLLDIEPGGENTPYESIQTVTATPQKQSGQMGAAAQETVNAETNSSGYDALKLFSDASDVNDGDDASDKLAQEQWFGGTTNTVTGEADKDLKPESQRPDTLAAKTRTQQGYGPGSGVGA